MENKLALRPKVNIPTPILSVIDKSLTELIKKGLDELADDLNKCIELGIEDDRLSRQANAVVEDAIKAEKAVNEIRRSFTRPIDEGKAKLMEEVKRLLSPVVSAKEKLDGLLMEKKRKAIAETAKIKREHEEAQRAADEAARTEKERRENISRTLRDDGSFKVAEVKAEVIAQPLDLSGLHSTVKTSSIVDKDKIEKAVESGTRKIPGVKIYQVWTFEVTDHKKVPEEYRKLRR